MSILNLKEEIATQHARLLAPGRSCDRCNEPPPDGETLKIAVVRFPAVSVPFSICERCVSVELDRFADHAMSHEAAKIFTAHQEPDGLKALTSELVRMHEIIAARSHCEECGHVLEADHVTTASLPLSGGMSGHNFLYVLCSTCRDRGTTPRLVARLNSFLGRLVSDRAKTFIHDLLEPKTVVN